MILPPPPEQLHESLGSNEVTAGSHWRHVRAVVASWIPWSSFRAGNMTLLGEAPPFLASCLASFHMWICCGRCVSLNFLLNWWRVESSESPLATANRYGIWGGEPGSLLWFNLDLSNLAEVPFPVSNGKISGKIWVSRVLNEKFRWFFMWKLHESLNHDAWWPFFLGCCSWDWKLLAGWVDLHSLLSLVVVLLRCFQWFCSRMRPNRRLQWFLLLGAWMIV